MLFDTNMGSPSAAWSDKNTVHSRLYNFKDGSSWRVRWLLFQWHKARRWWSRSRLRREGREVEK